MSAHKVMTGMTTMKCRIRLVFCLWAALFWVAHTPVAGMRTARAEVSASAAAGKVAMMSEDQVKRIASGVLRFGIHVSEMGRLDPHFAAGSQSRMVADMVFNGLLRYQPGNAPKIEPDLADGMPDFEMVGGQQVWTIHLRKGVMFHASPQTGTYELTADDVVYSLRKSADKNFCAYAGEYAGMSFKKIAPYTIQIILAQPLSPILFFPKLTNYAGGFIVSEQVIENMGYDYFLAHPVGTGPFMFGRYQPGEKLALVAHERYFRGRPLLAGVELHFVPDAQKREAALMAGELDVITVSGEKGWIERMDRVEGVVVDTHGVGEVFALYFNTVMPPLNDVRVRRAMAYALNRGAFKNTTSQRLVRDAYSPVPADFMPGGLSKADVQKLDLEYATDLDRARWLMKDAGYDRGFSLEVVTSKKRIYRRNYEVLQAQLAGIGIDCRVRVASHSDMHRLIRTEPQPIVIYAAWRPNADAYLSRFFHSDSIVVTGQKPDTNFAHYRKVDRLIEDARREINPKMQINLWNQAQILIMSDMAAYPIMYTIQGYARRRYVDYGHRLISTMALYPQFTEKTRLKVNR